jgi:hypothetical protein
VTSLKGELTLGNAHPGLIATVSFLRATEVSEIKQGETKQASVKKEETLHA